MKAKEGRDKVDVDDKVLLEYYRLEKSFEGEIDLVGMEEGLNPISGETGRAEKKKDPLTVLIQKINERYGTSFTEMDKVLLQLENDFTTDETWRAYASQMDYSTFMILFAKEFGAKAAARYTQNQDFFMKMFGDQEMMDEVMREIGAAVYERVRNQ